MPNGCILQVKFPTGSFVIPGGQGGVKVDIYVCFMERTCVVSMR